MVSVRPRDEIRNARVGERGVAGQNAGNEIGVGAGLSRYLHAIASDAVPSSFKASHQRVGLAKTRRDPELHNHIRRIQGTEVCNDLGLHRPTWSDGDILDKNTNEGPRGA